MLFKVTGVARRLGAIGIYYEIVDYIEGECLSQAIDNLYNSNKWDFFMTPRLDIYTPLKELFEVHQ